MILLAAVAATCAQAFSAVDLKCESLKDPLGIDAAKPRLSWVLASETSGQKQTAYQIEVRRDKAVIWDSGKIVSEQSVQVEYAGRELPPGSAFLWRVRVWDKDGKASEWSAPASFSTGIRDWQAKWIGYDAAYGEQAEGAAFHTQGLRWVRLPGNKNGALYLRKALELPADRKVRRAVFALFADNVCDAAVNQKPAGQAVRWDRTARLEVASALRPGKNVLALTAVNSDFQPAAVIGRLTVQFETGADMQVPVDATWKADGAAAAGWDGDGFDDSAWKAAEAFDGTPWGTPALNDHPRLPAPYLRKEFTVADKVKRATVYVTALGAYELHLNGQRVGRDELTPGWTEFRKRVEYQTYDVTAQVRAGKNALGAVLGDGWYASDLAFTGRRNYYGGRPRLLAQLVVEFADGRSQTVATDASWKAAYGPIRHADLMIGCEYDARLAMPGWDTAGFDDLKWAAVTEGGAGAEGVADVTGAVSAAVKDGRLSLKVENDLLGGDPAFNTVKTLRVEYRVGEKDEARTLAEHETLELAGLGLKVLRARYGNLAAGEKKTLVQASVAEPSRRHEELPALAISVPSTNVFIFDLGQNMVGWARFKLSGAAGQRVTVRYGEMLNPDGTLYTTNLRGATATDFFILSGKGAETLEPYFTFHGFRYVELRGLSGKPDLGAVTGVVVHSAMERTGAFECSSPLVNQLYHNIIWGQKGNYLEVPTDCPQRDERAGWTGDTQFFIPTAAYNFNVAPFFTRWLTTICEDAQHADGSFAHVVPDLGLGSGATAWGDAALICTYNIYRTYGDTRVIAAHFAALERLMAWYGTKSKGLVPDIGGFGDWLNLGGSASREVIDTAYYAHLAGLMEEMARAIGNAEAAERYAKLHDDVKAVFAGFFEADGALRGCSQTGYALAFSMDLVPEALREKAAAKFAAEIERFKGHLATGFIGTPRLLPALHAAGRDDLAYGLLLQETFPSWLFQVKLGATTMWERWDGWTPDKGFQDKGMNSFNHYAFGSVGEYLYGSVAGIRADAPGYKKIRIQPVIGEGLTWAKASYDSVYGKIASSWKLEAGKLTLDVTIPANTTATVFVPGTGAAAPAGATLLRTQDGASVYAVGSGTCRFVSQLK